MFFVSNIVVSDGAKLRKMREIQKEMTVFFMPHFPPLHTTT